MKILFSGCLLVASAGMMAGCHGGAASSQAPIETVQAQVVKSRQLAVPTNLRSTGTVHARQTAMISAEVAGRIQAVLVRAGDSVYRGQTLAVLYDSDLRSSRRPRRESQRRRMKRPRREATRNWPPALSNAISSLNRKRA
jgi:multidrug efflux pump subunit AcrA (membrane-fusion protein)